MQLACNVYLHISTTHCVLINFETKKTKNTFVMTTTEKVFPSIRFCKLRYNYVEYLYTNHTHMCNELIHEVSNYA